MSNEKVTNWFLLICKPYEAERGFDNLSTQGYEVFS
jgi:hypothetical protein